MWRQWCKFIEESAQRDLEAKAGIKAYKMYMYTRLLMRARLKVRDKTRNGYDQLIRTASRIINSHQWYGLLRNCRFTARFRHVDAVKAFILRYQKSRPRRNCASRIETLPKIREIELIVPSWSRLVWLSDHNDPWLLDIQVYVIFFLFLFFILYSIRISYIFILSYIACYIFTDN